MYTWQGGGRCTQGGVGAQVRDTQGGVGARVHMTGWGRYTLEGLEQRFTRRMRAEVHRAGYVQWYI